MDEWIKKTKKVIFTYLDKNQTDQVQQQVFKKNVLRKKQRSLK